MSVSVDRVVSTILIAGGNVIVHEKARIATHRGVPSYDSDPWFSAHNLLALTTTDLFIKILGSWVAKKGEEANIGKLSKILKDMDLWAVAEAMSSLGGSEATIILSSSQQEPKASTSTHVATPKSISFGVKEPIIDFVGRADELKKLNDIFVNQRQNCVVIYAIGGQGKTELCKKFIHNLINFNSSPPVVAWLPGASTQEFSSKVSKLARRLSISTDDDEGKPLPLLRLLRNVAKQIRNQTPDKRWLVVVDNVDEEHLELEKNVQILIDNEAFVLITSRRNDILPGAATTTSLQLETLSPFDAMVLVRNSLTNSADEDVTLLCDMVGNHALGLQQSVAYIKMQMQIGTSGKAYGISYFIQEFQDCQKIILQHPVKLVNYNHTIHAIVRTALDSISTKYGNIGQVAQELGIILGLINPDGIHLDILQKLHNSYIENRPNPVIISGSMWSRLLSRFNGRPTTGSTSGLSTIKETEEAVLLLAKYSMVSLNDEVVSIHRLVQMVLRLEFEYEPTINILLKLIETKTSSLEELRQLISIWEHADHETVKTYSNSSYQIFIRMCELSLVLELSAFAEKNRTLLSQLLGPNHVETLEMEYCVSRAIYQKGDNETALIKFRTLHEKEKRELGEEHPSTLNTASAISSVLWCLNRHEEALEWKEKELESRVKVLGENHIDTITSRNNKALILQDLGRMDEALSMHQQVLNWREMNLGSSHPRTLSTRHNIALIRFHQEQFNEARSEFETLLKLSVEVLGEEHIHTLATKHSLAFTYWKFNRREDAVRIMEEVLVSYEKVLGPSHPQTNLPREALSTWREYQSGDIPSLAAN